MCWPLARQQPCHFGEPWRLRPEAGWLSHLHFLSACSCAIPTQPTRSWTMAGWLASAKEGAPKVGTCQDCLYQTLYHDSAYRAAQPLMPSAGWELRRHHFCATVSTHCFLCLCPTGLSCWQASRRACTRQC